jgi:hypothetical protein
LLAAETIIRVHPMATDQTAEEVLAEHMNVLGDDFGLLFNVLHNDLHWLYLQWFEFKALFSTNEKRIALCNQSAPLMFHLIQRTMADNVILSIARFVDSEHSGGKDNLTIRRLPPFVEAEGKRDHLQALVDRATRSASFARDRRHRNIAHRDLALALKQPVEPLAAATLADIDNALEAIQDVLAWINKEYFDAQFLYDMASARGGGASLLSIVREGLQAREQRLKRIEQGTATQEDYDLRGAP